MIYTRSVSIRNMPRPGDLFTVMSPRRCDDGTLLVVGDIVACIDIFESSNSKSLLMNMLHKQGITKSYIPDNPIDDFWILHIL